MFNKLSLILLLFMHALILSGCTKEPVDTDMTNPEPEEKMVPIVMVHGALASGDTYSKHSMLWTSNGYRQELLHAFDWNSLGGNNALAIEQLDNLINGILQTFKTDKIVLIGHSAGGGLSYNYCNDTERAKKILKYVHIGSSAMNNLPGPDKNIPTLNIYSKGDKIVAGANITGAENVVFDDLDHYEVATAEASFEQIYNFIKAKKPSVKQIIRKNSPFIKGRIVSLGENAPDTNVNVKVYKINPLTGERIGNPLHNFKPKSGGYFDQLQVNADDYHEFEITSPSPQFRTLHYYREPFIHDNAFVYLRTFPPANSLAGILLSNLPKDDTQSVVAVFSANKSIIHQRDRLDVQDMNLANEVLCAPQNSVIAMFLYDNGDKNSTGNGHAAFGLFPFLRGADIYFPASAPESLTLRLNNRQLTVKNYKSASEGVVIAVFD
jgi:hypothetical protein